MSDSRLSLAMVLVCIRSDILSVIVIFCIVCGVRVLLVL